MPRVTTNGVETYYERRGDGPPVVCIHGLVLDHRMWYPQVAALEDEYELVTYDYRGHGNSEASTLPDYSVGQDRVDGAMQFLAERLFDVEGGPDEEVPELGTTPSEYTGDARAALSRRNRRSSSTPGRHTSERVRPTSTSRCCTRTAN